MGREITRLIILASSMDDYSFKNPRYLATDGLIPPFGHEARYVDKTAEGLGRLVKQEIARIGEGNERKGLGKDLNILELSVPENLGTSIPCACVVPSSREKSIIYFYRPLTEEEREEFYYGCGIY